MSNNGFMTTAEVAELFRISPTTLCRWRQTGRGPQVVWLSASCPRYRVSDVHEWLEDLAG